jgi:hypothetical protein
VRRHLCTIRSVVVAASVTAASLAGRSFSKYWIFVGLSLKTYLIHTAFALICRSGI